jgi:hypothetical protein
MVTWVQYRSGVLRAEFDWMQKTSLVIMAGSLAYWALYRDQSEVTFWTVQLLLVVSYVPTVFKALHRRSAFDSIGNWALIVAGTIVGIIPAIMMQSVYGLINSGRGIVCSAITLLILLHFDRKNGRSRWKDEVTTHARFWKGLFA